MFKEISIAIPNLNVNLKQAGIKLSPEKFIKKIIITDVIVSINVNIALLLVFLRLKIGIGWLILLFPLTLLVMFFFLVNSPKAGVKKRINNIDKEIVYATRFLLVELSAGIPLFDAIRTVAAHFKSIGPSFQEIVDRVEVGKPIDQSIAEVIEITPSTNFRKVLWQITNSLRTGADVSQALSSITEQISKEQLIRIKDYGRKLNPLVMFFLMIAVIAPSLGITMLALLSTFLGFSLTLGSLIGIGVLIGLIQFMFLSVINNSRPGIEL